MPPEHERHDPDERPGPYEVRAAPAGVEPPDPPAAPEIDRRVRFRFGQLVGLLFVAAVPAMGLAVVFGSSPSVHVAGDEAVSVRVTYPRVQRHKVRDRLSSVVTNTGAATIESVEVRLSNAYLLSFSDVALTPSPASVDETDHVFVLTALEPGESNTVVAEMQADDYWISRGTVSWSRSGSDSQATRSGRLDIATLTWP